MARQKSNVDTHPWPPRAGAGSTFLSLVLLAVPAGCGSTTALKTPQPDSLPVAGIDVRATGGIAALDLHATIDSTTGEAVLTTRPLCAPTSECQDLVPPAQRILDRTTVDAFFARMATPEFSALHPDYGTTPNGADMRSYVITIRKGGVVRTLRGDDGSLPPLLAAFVSDVLNAPRGSA